MLEMIFTVIFFGEMCLLMYALGLRGYFKRPFNGYDFVVSYFIGVDNFFVRDPLKYFFEWWNLFRTPYISFENFCNFLPSCAEERMTSYLTFGCVHEGVPWLKELSDSNNAVFLGYHFPDFFRIFLISYLKISLSLHKFYTRVIYTSKNV